LKLGWQLFGGGCGGGGVVVVDETFSTIILNVQLRYSGRWPHSSLKSSVFFAFKVYKKNHNVVCLFSLVRMFTLLSVHF
jgi:hypothetical protein